MRDEADRPEWTRSPLEKSRSQLHSDKESHRSITERPHSEEREPRFFSSNSGQSSSDWYRSEPRHYEEERPSTSWRSRDADQAWIKNEKEYKK